MIGSHEHYGENPEGMDDLELMDMLWQQDLAAQKKGWLAAAKRIEEDEEFWQKGIDWMAKIRAQNSPSERYLAQWDKIVQEEGKEGVLKALRTSRDQPFLACQPWRLSSSSLANISEI